MRNIAANTTAVAFSSQFKAAQIQVQKLCNGDYQRPLKFEFLDWDSDGGHDHMGYIETNLASIIEGVGKPSGRMPVQYKGKTHGALVIMKADVFQLATLTEFLSGGMQMSLMVAVDFTGSNGSPMIPGTLHYLDPRGLPNQYQSAISCIGGILQEYDTDKRFPIWGFGARINGVVNHCFQIGESEEVHGVGGLLDAYRGGEKSKRREERSDEALRILHQLSLLPSRLVASFLFTANIATDASSFAHC